MKFHRTLIVWCWIGLVGSVVPVRGQSDDVERLKAENAELKSEVSKMRSDMDEMRKTLAQMQATLATLKPAPAAAAPAAPAVPAPAAQAAAAPAPKAEKPAVRSKYAVDLYGYAKLDAAWDSSRTNPGNYARWAESEATNPDDSEANITANETRVGLDFTGPEGKGMKTTGKLEVDFYGGGTENKPVPMMRHAYFQVEWPKHDFSILAGQTWDVIAPLLPTMINYSPAWWAGNIGYRHPQLRMTKGFKLAEGTKILFQGAMVRTIGDATSLSPGDTGEDSALPTFQGRAALQFPGPGKQSVVIGVSGHYGRDELDITNTGVNVRIPTWSANVDLTIPLHKKIAFKGEFFRGANLDTYLGGIGQGVNLTTLRQVATTGGWASLSFGPFQKWRFNIGGAIDDPNDFDLNNNDRTLNEVYFGNALFNLNEAVQIGFELSNWHTNYKRKASGDALRFQTSFIYRF
ncbi:MAG: hypothetical protein KA419_08285 [Acidobacteria bacterium]|nr:hypothetical protein [Acidobacteriota bacterium]